MNTLLSFFVMLSVGFCDIGISKPGPLGHIKIHEFSECDGGPYKFPIIASVSNFPDGTDAINVDIDLDRDVDSSLEINIEFALWVDGGWQEKFYDKASPLLEFIKSFFSKIFANFRNSIEPKIERDDFVKKGRYVLTDFKDTYKNANAPSIVYGKFKGTFTLIQNEEVLGCLHIVLDALENTDLKLFGK